MSDEPLASVGPELARMNRMIFAERTGWPDGALEECEKLEAKSPGWYINWSHGGDMTWAEPGYYAELIGWHYTDPVRYLYGATIEDLAAAIGEHPVPQRGLAEYRPLDLPGRD